MIELAKMHSRKEIYKSVANIALISDITRKIEKVISIAEESINFLSQFFDGILIRNIPYHNGRSGIEHDLILSYQKYTTLLCFISDIAISKTEIGVIVGLIHIVGHFWTNIHRTCRAFLEGVG